MWIITEEQIGHIEKRMHDDLEHRLFVMISSEERYSRFPSEQLRSLLREQMLRADPYHLSRQEMVAFVRLMLAREDLRRDPLPRVLQSILTDEEIAPRERIELLCEFM